MAVTVAGRGDGKIKNEDEDDGEKYQEIIVHFFGGGRGCSLVFLCVSFKRRH